MNNLGDLNINTIESLAKIRRTPDEAPPRGVLVNTPHKVIGGLGHIPNHLLLDVNIQHNTANSPNLLLV